MHLDWYDRRIVSFVLDSDLLSQPNESTRVQFGMDARRIMKRFDAVLDVSMSQQLPLDAADMDLVNRARQYRATTRPTCAV
ncbi:MULTISPECIES: hypothetical protein [Mycobacteriaceae]|uniref:hypothetical protein n=1 Tax=Mycobacteriaceae TaxID=1762 RepID=UPI0007EB5B6B|nr:hypothetical protein [Mycobacterium sp. 852013-50091_SCH5140682]OBC17092.1 hypothetical protein A5784_24855 [Mycobacterium sp. 852013-50091_SCH5140682]